MEAASTAEAASTVTSRRTAARLASSMPCRHRRLRRPTDLPRPSAVSTAFTAIPTPTISRRRHDQPVHSPMGLPSRLSQHHRRSTRSRSSNTRPSTSRRIPTCTSSSSSSSINSSPPEVLPSRPGNNLSRLRSSTKLLLLQSNNSSRRRSRRTAVFWAASPRAPLPLFLLLRRPHKLFSRLTNLNKHSNSTQALYNASSLRHSRPK